MRSEDLRGLLERSGSYPAITGAAASGALHDVLPVNLSDHIGAVYERLETAADPQFADMAKMRLAVLLHEESPASLRDPLMTAGLVDFAPIVMGVIAGFGKVWKITTDHEIDEYVAAERAHPVSLLLFELAHEGRATPAMKSAAQRGGIARDFERWRERLTGEFR